MIGYILIGIGAWLVLDDWKIARAAKKIKNHIEGGRDGQLHKNGDVRSSGDSAGKSGTIHQKPDRDRGIGIPVKEKPKKGDKDNDVSEKPVHKVKSGQNSDSSGDNRGGQPDSTPVGDQGQSLSPSVDGSDKSKSKEGGQDAGTENDHENGISDNGDHVHLESDSRDESNGAETD